MLRLLVALFLIAFGAACQAPPPPPPAKPPPPPPPARHVTAFVDVSVVPLDSERVLPGLTVMVSGDRIIAVGASLKVPKGARVIDGRGKFLMPGLTDMHAHLQREEDLQLYLARGVTTVRNMWGAPMHLAWRERIARGEMLGPTIYTAGPLVDGESPVHDGSLVVRTAEEAENAVRLHQRAGYDFIKVYSKLSPAAYKSLMAAAKKAGLPVAGHVPREVGLVDALSAGQLSIEHMNVFLEALQADGSPVAGKFDPESWQRKIEFIDEKKLSELVQRFVRRRAYFCPTRTVMNPLAPDADTRARLERPEMRYVPSFELAIWRPTKETPAAEAASNQRELALANRVITAMRDGGARMLVGTDTGNPLVIPGFSVHEELALLVQAGLSPLQVLQAATRHAADLMRDAELGTVAVSGRADLLLLEGNPLENIAHTERIAGVMVRGRWLGNAERSDLMSKVEAFAREQTDPLASMPPVVVKGREEFAATYRIRWRDARFGAERIVVGRNERGERIIHAQTFDAHQGQGITMHLWPGEAGLGTRLMLESDGAQGRGRAAALRRGTNSHVAGASLPGISVDLDAKLEETAYMSARGFVATTILFAQKLQAMKPGNKLDVVVGQLALGSAVELPTTKWTIVRTPAEDGALRFAISPDKGPKSVLVLDPNGWPLAYEINAYGSTVSFERISR